MLGSPQFMLNYRRQNTSGLSPILILIWLTGDLYKLSYYVANTSPFALRACASFQIFTDLCILSQFVIYRKNNKATEDTIDDKILYKAVTQKNPNILIRST